MSITSAFVLISFSFTIGFILLLIVFFFLTLYCISFHLTHSCWPSGEKHSKHYFQYHGYSDATFCQRRINTPLHHRHHNQQNKYLKEARPSSRKIIDSFISCIKVKALENECAVELMTQEKNYIIHMKDRIVNGSQVVPNFYWTMNEQVKLMHSQS